MNEEVENNENKKKQKVAILIGVVTLLVAVLGATYAYFMISTSSDTTNTDVNVKIGESNSVALSGGIDLHITLSAEDMAKANQNDYYAVTDERNNSPTKNNITFATLTSVGVYNNAEICTAKLKVSIGNTMSSVLQPEDVILHVEGGRSKHDIDLALLLKEYPIEFIVDSENKQNVTGYLKISNRDVDQTYLAGKTLDVTMTLDEVSCKPQNNKDAVEMILANSDDDTLEKAEDVSARGDVIRRFQGSATEVQDNYICFGTKEKADCTTNANKYMYRIMGVALNNDEETNIEYGQLKLIKKEALEETAMYGPDKLSETKWKDSGVYQNLIGNAYLTNLDLVPADWKSKIANHTWYTGKMSTEYPGHGGNQIGKRVFIVEMGKDFTIYDEYDGVSGFKTWLVPSYGNPDLVGQTIKYDIIDNQKWDLSDKITSQVGLMNVSDYLLSIGPNMVCAGTYDDSSRTFEECGEGWIHLRHNDSQPPYHHEATMNYEGFFYRWANYTYTMIGSYDNTQNGVVGKVGLPGEYSERPVIYLNSGLELSGAGTLENPYIIEN